MFRAILIAAAMMMISAQAALAGHGESAAPPPAPKPEGPAWKIKIGKNGPILTDRNGMTLYYFERDVSGSKSTCNDKCTEKRPPLMADANSVANGDFTVMTRDDGSKMWAYRYRPLYTSVADKAPDEINGDDPAHFWRVARPK